MAPPPPPPRPPSYGIQEVHGPDGSDTIHITGDLTASDPEDGTIQL
jgi:hypothetical protein